MSGPAGVSGSTSTRVRAATHEDLPAVVAAVGGLLSELGSRPPRASEMLEAGRALLEEPRVGALLVAEAGGEDVSIVGVLAASYQLALHVPGRYVLIQDLWVRPSWRGRSVGRELLARLFELARRQGMARAEVGLPRESFEGIRATEEFYAGNGFEHLGARMRRILT
ncbi:MAG TPA: GNAT family N-acetyltransferase [Solirubrobacteraceae bacterium]|jgi:GNAT superfamily N-acetyltransferase|nr:GNAT family N-acetyltransferase [Solirubrobacteraceae bacterium]